MWSSYVNQLDEDDMKWDTSYTNLTFEDILGEGEFGRVFKASAIGLQGKQQNTTVAVKMLKGDLLAVISLSLQVVSILCVCMSVCVCAFVRVCLCVCFCVFLCLCICMFACIHECLRVCLLT